MSDWNRIDNVLCLHIHNPNFIIFKQIKEYDQNLPEILFSPIGQFQPRGTVTLSCKTNDKDFESVEFTRNNVLISPSLDKRISRNTDASLVITSLDYQIDNGDYRCIVKNNRGKIQSLKKRLDVKSMWKVFWIFFINLLKLSKYFEQRALFLSGKV